MIIEGIAPFLDSVMIPQVIVRLILDALDSELTLIGKFDSLDRVSLEIEAQIKTELELLSVDAIANHPRVSSLAFTAHVFGETILDGPCVSLDGLI